MAKIDTSGWKEFVVGELFPNMVKPSVLHMRQVVETDEGIRYVVRTKFNNGIKCRVHPVDGVEPSPAGVITWGAENASFFYQEEVFLSGRDIYYVDTRKYSANVCRFLATCLQTVVFKYPYNFGLFPELLKDERIMLPVDSNGEPNWTYMEVYMQKVLDEVETNIETMQNVEKEKSILDIKEWKKFVIGDLFEISRPIARSQAEYVEGNVPFVASGNYNNGIVKWCMPKEDESLDFGNCITVSPLDGSAFYQKENFLGRGGAGSAILMLRNAELTELSGLFIASVIRNALTKYSYSDQLNSQTIADEIIRLPIVKNTEKPDYTYMELYMKSMMDSAESVIEKFESLDFIEKN